MLTRLFHFWSQSLSLSGVIIALSCAALVQVRCNKIFHCAYINSAKFMRVHVRDGHLRKEIIWGSGVCNNSWLSFDPLHCIASPDSLGNALLAGVPCTIHVEGLQPGPSFHSLLVSWSIHHQFPSFSVECVSAVWTLYRRMTPSSALMAQVRQL